MSATVNPFGGPEPWRVDALAEEIGRAFVAGYAPVAQRHIFDGTLHPAVLSAAVAKAHAAGLAAMIRAGAGGDTDQLVTDVMTWVRAEVARP